MASGGQRVTCLFNAMHMSVSRYDIYNCSAEYTKQLMHAASYYYSQDYSVATTKPFPRAEV